MQMHPHLLGGSAAVLLTWCEAQMQMPMHLHLVKGSVAVLLTWGEARRPVS